MFERLAKALEFVSFMMYRTSLRFFQGDYYRFVCIGIQVFYLFAIILSKIFSVRDSKHSSSAMAPKTVRVSALSRHRQDSQESLQRDAGASRRYPGASP
uniref:Uncharacterized protein n=1 Tax=Candidatus Kentrum sp. SD TaxID=2126332 RepID=A0A450YG61_9GAMM|nr:MAG: hypothetical protein BECKSD772F_GA0070984_100713 [Candidatus Kentron sp. SD]VFK40524.1 MAG: hypothetical protein BECKSD772E_GA0070983_100712 [Candidatus Kentron sp. SD]VFK78370.1 MAG: hypothetical protein BECKSD772D_GA0070982_101314 [Candidatus Kentron sp. SD]